MDPCRQAIALNNAGVVRLQNNENCGGLAAIEQAMGLVRGAILNTGTTDRDCTSRNVATDQLDIVFLQRGKERERFDSNQPMGSPAAMSCGTDDFYIIDSPIHIPSSLLDTHHGSELHTVISTVLLFNMALVRCRLDRTSPDSGHRVAAAKLYDSLLGVLDEAMAETRDCNRETHGSSFWTVCKCLVLNNRSHFYYEDLEYGKSQACLEELYSLVRTHEECLLEASLGTQAAFEIYFNVLYPRREPMTAVAA